MVSRKRAHIALQLLVLVSLSAVAAVGQAGAFAEPVLGDPPEFGPWHWQTPLPQGNNLRGVFVSDASTATIVGEEFTILRTDDMGATWTFQGPNPVLSGGAITRVFFADSSTGFAVTLMAVSNTDPEVPILRTIDSGETWTAHASGMPRGSQFNDVYFTDVDNGWAGGGLGNGLGGSCEGPMLLRTIDGGSSWEDFSNAPGLVTDATCPTIKAVHFLDVTTGFVLMNRAATDGTALFRTTDGGSSWMGILTPATINRQDLFMIDAATGVMTTGTDGIWHTADGGDTWTHRWPNGNLASVTFVDADHGWAVGNVGTTPLILHTSDGGLTWTSQPSNTPQGLHLGDVHFHDSDTGYVVGRSGVVLRTTNGGTTWENLSSGHEIFHRLKDVTFVDAVAGWAVGFLGIIVHTSDGGANWALQNGGTGLFLGAVSFVDSDRGWIAGDAGTILHTTNGGKSWAPQNTGSAATLFDVTFVDAASGWAVGALGTILHTANGGAPWSTQNSGTTLTLEGVSFVDADTGWAVGALGTILHTSDGGESWVPQDAPDIGAGNLFLNAVHFTDTNHGWIAGRVEGSDLGGVVLGTTNGGDTWTLQESGISVSANGISFLDATIGIVVGANGTILRTENGGATWTPETRRTNGGLESVAMIDADTAAWTVGVPGGGSGSGLILRRGSVDMLPTVMILEPKDGSTFVEGDSVTFVGSAVDAEGGDISPSLEWNSSLDGPIGSGASFTTSTLSPGSHTINATVTDAGGLPGADSIGVTIEPIGGTPPEIDIDPVSLSSELSQGQMEVQALTVTNLGDDTLDWVILDEDGGLERGVRTVGLETTLTHSKSLDILSGNTFACFSQADGTTRANSFLRTFTLSDFDIFEALDVTAVTFGVQELTGAAPITVNLYTLEGEFTFDNLTLIGSLTEELAPQELTLVTMQVAGTAPAGSTLVIEIAAPELVGVAAFRAGSNDLGETAPSYLAAAACGITEPRPYADVFGGFPNVHLVMTVTGETVEPVDCSLPDWAGVEPSSGSVPGGEDRVVNVTFDATGLETGEFAANLCVSSNDPVRPLTVVPLTLTVTEPVGKPALSFEPPSLDFSEVAVGQTSSPQDTALHNTGEAGATELAFDLSGSGVFDFDASACGDSLPAGESCLVSVTFTPIETGTAAAALTASSAEGASALVDLTGQGVEAGAGFTAAALEVDPDEHFSDGNRVFEPGETVVVAPSWRNDDVTSQPLSGAAAGFTGPEGAVYTVVMADADYGVLASGETASCLETGICYVLDVDGPSARPATRWVAAFDEDLSDGTTKTWSLHIGDSFMDVPRESPFYRSVETLLHHEVTGGCSETDYCPTSVNTRGQMPVFVLRALEGADFTPPACVPGAEAFADVPATSGLCPWIQELFARNVVAGCGEGLYCPNAPVNRQQMAIFLLRTLEGEDYTPKACTGAFADVPCTSPFAAWVEDLYARGVTGGCGTEPLVYCPTDAVNRQQMAVFVTETFGLVLYGP